MCKDPTDYLSKINMELMGKIISKRMPFKSKKGILYPLQSKFKVIRSLDSKEFIDDPL